MKEPHKTLSTRRKPKAQKSVSKSSLSVLAGYADLLTEVKSRIYAAQARAVLSANSEMIALYWDVGRIIEERQKREGWGAAVIPRLARDIRNEFSEVKGFSERNIGRMIAFYRAYPNLSVILPQAVAKLPLEEKSLKAQSKTPETLPQPAAKSEINRAMLVLQQLVGQLPWGHHILLIEKVKDLSTRLWYMQLALTQGWSRNILTLQIQSRAHERKGQAITNFQMNLPAPQSELARQALKDPYIFDFLTLEEPFHEREMETSLIRHLEKFLLELGQGFAFVGRQVHLDVGENDFYIDLLFYHLKLRCFFVIDLKKGAFKPEYAGKMNFYCSVVDDRLRHATDHPTIGLILCQDKNRIVAEYALRDVKKPIGVSEYELTRALPDSLRSALPTIEEIERELSNAGSSA